MVEKKSLKITVIVSAVILLISIAVPLKNYLNKPSEYEVIENYPS